MHNPELILDHTRLWRSRDHENVEFLTCQDEGMNLKMLNFKNQSLALRKVAR